MKLPSAEEYLHIVEAKAPGSLGSLHNFQFLKKDDDNLWYEKGRYAIVFKAEHHSKNYAVRFFLDDDTELFRRYIQVQEYLNHKSLPWCIPFEFLDKGFYPVLKMDWVDGLSFVQYLNSIINDPLQISRLQLQFTELSRSLEENGIGHGDINLNHIRFVKEGEKVVLKLMDYDSVFIPAFQRKDCLRPGAASFQHPMRLASDYSETIDRFSIWVFITALEAFKTDASLWTFAAKNGYDQSKELLFNFRDLAFPDQSRAFQILKNYNKDSLNYYAGKLIAFCKTRSLKNIEAPRLFEQKYLDEPPKSKSTIEVKNDNVAPVKPQHLQQKPIELSSKTTKPKISLPKKEAIAEKPKAGIQLQKKVSAKKQPSITSGKNKKGRGIVIVATATLIFIISVFLIKAQNSSIKSPSEMGDAPPKTISQVQLKPAEKEVFFTSANITQFLSQLYQSYNSRDLQTILSNYTDSVQYYDAGAVTKNKLKNIIQNLFIKPAYYECQPDLTTLHFNVKGNECFITILINETIQTDQGSKTENYSSKIEYTINRSFKIVAEKRIG